MEQLLIWSRLAYNKWLLFFLSTLSSVFSENWSSCHTASIVTGVINRGWISSPENKKCQRKKGVKTITKNREK